QTARHSAGDEYGQFTGQWTAFISQLLGELFEIHAADQLHRDKKHPIRFAEMIGLDDVGMDQIGDEFGFSDEIFDESLLVGIVLPNHFDGDALDEIPGAELFRLVNDAHPALKNLSYNFVSEVTLDGKKSHWFDVERK